MYLASKAATITAYAALRERAKFANQQRMLESNGPWEHGSMGAWENAERALTGARRSAEAHLLCGGTLNLQKTGDENMRAKLNCWRSIAHEIAKKKEKKRRRILPERDMTEMIFPVRLLSPFVRGKNLAFASNFCLLFFPKHLG